MIYLFVFKGTKSVGKVVYVTVITPYVMLTALLIRGCTLSGAFTGIEYFLGLNGKGDWGKLAEVNVWVNAASQVYNSIGIGFGSLIAFSSFNRYGIRIYNMCIMYVCISSNEYYIKELFNTNPRYSSDWPCEFFNFYFCGLYHLLRPWPYFRNGGHPDRGSPARRSGAYFRFISTGAFRYVPKERVIFPEFFFIRKYLIDIT
jgi:hypothetical protein